MQQKTTVERVLHYIGRKLRKDAVGWGNPLNIE